NPVFIDRFLATSEAYSVPALLLFNKTDIYNNEDSELMEAFINLYETIGYRCLRISVKTRYGIDALKPMLSDKITLLSGNSGVGKSSLINALLPDLSLKTGDISVSHHKGMHTTTFSEMYQLPEGGYIVDTPGIKGFGTIDFDEKEVAHYFPEIFKASIGCRFNNCTHRNEPGCAVLKALEEHKISESRYTSYLSIIEDIGDGKYRAGY
ncbi:MAG: ribosome small subunit-dependent GTPase A, partial [Bacteroidales bacterium]